MIDEEIAFTAAVVPRPMPIAAKGATGALLVRVCAVVSAWVGTVVVVGVDVVVECMSYPFAIMVVIVLKNCNRVISLSFIRTLSV